MNKYFNGAKDKISSKDYKWLINKIRGINDNKGQGQAAKAVVKKAYITVDWITFVSNGSFFCHSWIKKMAQPGQVSASQLKQEILQKYVKFSN